MNNQFSLLFLLISITDFSGCAGPTTPLGAVWTVLPIEQPSIESLMGFSVSKSETTDSLSPKIKLTPGKQVLHGPAPIKVMIEDANGGFSNYRFTVMYNGVDVTRSFTQYSKKSVNLFTKTLTIEYPRVRLKANQEHWIEFSYRNNLGGSARAHYEAPSCGAFKPTTVLSTGDFETPQYFMELVEDFIGEYSKHRPLTSEERGLIKLALKDEFVLKTLFVLKEMYIEHDRKWSKDLSKFVMAFQEIGLFF